MGRDDISPETLIESYGLDAQVRVGEHGGMVMPLGKALQFEVTFCPADADTRLDPAKRVGYLAHILDAAGSLRAEHSHLVGEAK